MIRILVAAMAATRLVRALLVDDIGEPFRSGLDRLDPPPYTIHDNVLDLRKMRIREVRLWFVDLGSCPHCLGFWLTLAMVIAHRIRPTRPLVEALAGALILSTIVDHDRYDYTADEQ